METKHKYMDRMEDKQTIYLNLPGEIFVNGIPLRQSYCWMYFWDMVKINWRNK